MNKYTTWLKITAACQILTGLAHAMSFLVSPEPANDTERHLTELLRNYTFDLGAGFHRTMEQLINVVSAHFSLAYILAGLINWYLASKKADTAMVTGIVNINLFVFTISVVLNLLFAFLPPITLTGLSFLFLLLTRFSLAKT